MHVKAVSEVLQQALQSELGDRAPIYLYADNELFELSIQVFPKGEMGPGSVLLIKEPLKPKEP